MHFEVNGIPYFLTFSPDEGGWLLLTPVASGFKRLEVVNDDALLVVPSAVETGDDDLRRV